MILLLFYYEFIKLLRDISVDDKSKGHLYIRQQQAVLPFIKL